MGEETLNFPPFPPLRWEGDSWVADITLPSWAGFQSRQDSSGPSDGTAQLWVVTSGTGSRDLPTPEQVAAFRYLIENEAAVAASVGQALIEYYPGEKDHYLDDEEEGTDPENIKSLIGLTCVHVLPVVKDGAAYIGFEFECDWDEEHGSGVMTHLGRVVATGQVDVSFLEWIAEKDAAKQ